MGKIIESTLIYIYGRLFISLVHSKWRQNNNCDNSALFDIVYGGELNFTNDASIKLRFSDLV